MSTTSNVFSQGGGGGAFEINVQTAYFVYFLIGGTVPGLPEARIVEFRQQAGSLGYQTDDLLLHAQSDRGSHKLLFQIKHAITITDNSPIFVDVVTAAWNDFKNSTLFNPTLDKIYLICAGFPMEVKNHLLPVLAWAKSKETFEDFINEIDRIAVKKKYYNYFKTIINGIDPGYDEQRLYHFLRCYHLLDYDLDQTNSVIKSGLLNLINIAKESNLHSGINIWNEIHEMLTSSNPTGGLYRHDGIITHLTNKLKQTYLPTVQKELLKLSHQSQEFLEIISDKIGGYQLDRSALLAKANEKLNASQILIVTGDAGTGKSAISKALLFDQDQSNGGYILVIKADELLNGQLHNWFRNAGLHHNIQEVFAHFSLSPHGLVYVDGLEKLLEDTAEPFKQLIKAIQNYPAIKLIASCRKSLLNVLTAKFFLSAPYEELEVSYLTDNELDLVSTSIPGLKAAISNPDLQQLVRIPKYLDFSHTAIQLAGGDYSNISELEFQDHLWSAIVENVFDGDKDGLPLRRRTSFMDIAVTRTRKMQQYVAPTAPDALALEALKKETVLLQFKQQPLYAPAHDVLEDWALARYTDHLFATKSSDADFFNSLGTEAPMRRAYRLWVQYALKQQAKDKIEFFTRNLKDSSQSHYWHTESLIAILLSPHCETFLQNNLLLLQQHEWSLLFKIIHVLRTASKANGQYLDKKVHVPIGYGWGPIIRILHQHKESIVVNYFTQIQDTLTDWSMIVQTTERIDLYTRDAGLLTIHLLNIYISGDNRIRRNDSQLEELIKLTFTFAGGITEELLDLINNAENIEKQEMTGENHNLVNFSEQFLKIALSGLDAPQLPKYLPEKVISLAKDRWYLKPYLHREEEEDEDEYRIIAQFSRRSSLDHNYIFGLASNDFSHETASAYKTPIYWLLKHHTDLAIEFINDLLNHSTEHYQNNPHSGDKIVSITLPLQCGNFSNQIGSYYLWVMYRGLTGAGSTLLKNVLMALEKYLLEVGANGESQSEHFRNCLSKLLAGSKSVSITAVIASAVQANPVAAGQWILPILGQAPFYSWDVNRYMQDLSPLYILRDNSVYTNERLAAHSQPHRTKYMPGLRGFVMFYSITIGIFNRQIFELIDWLKATADSEDLNWRKTLEDIDARNMVPTKAIEYEGKPAIELEIKYSDDINRMVSEFKTQQDPINKLSTYISLLKNADEKEGESNIKFEEWQEIFTVYHPLTEYHSLYHTPGLVAKIGIRDFIDQLTEEQKSWCFDTLLHITYDFTVAGFTHNTLGILESHIYDPAAVVSFLPKLLTIPAIINNSEYKMETEKAIFRLMLCFYEDNSLPYNKFLESLEEKLWPNNPELATMFWKGILAFGRKSHQVPLQRNFENTESFAKELLLFVEDFMDKVYAGEYEINLDEVDISTFESYTLKKALHLSPVNNPPSVIITFLKKELTFYLNNETQPRYQLRKNLNNLRDSLQHKFANIFFENADGIGAELMTYFCNHLNDPKIIAATIRDVDSLFGFFYGTLKQTIHSTDNALCDTKRQIDAVGRQFHSMWKSLYSINAKLSYPMYYPILLLNIDWKKDVRHWPPIEGLEQELLGLISTCTPRFNGAVTNLLSTVGDQALLPKALEIFAVHNQKADPTKSEIFYKETKAEEMAQRIYNYHLEQIKSDTTQFAAFQWLLEKLISEGSTEAYWLYEFVMSYHRHAMANTDQQIHHL